MDEPYSRFVGDNLYTGHRDAFDPLDEGYSYTPRYNEIMGNSMSTGYYEPATKSAPQTSSYYTYDAVNSYRDFAGPAQYTDTATPYADVGGHAPRPLFAEQVTIPARFLENVVVNKQNDTTSKGKETKKAIKKIKFLLLLFIYVLIVVVLLAATYAVARAAREDD